MNYVIDNFLNSFIKNNKTLQAKIFFYNFPKKT
jgi:hypothetical protein